MANIPQFLVLTLLIILSKTLFSNSKTLVLPITKDPSFQYTTHLTFGTPPAKVGLVLDIGGRHVCFDCLNTSSYKSSISREAICGSAACSLAGFCVPSEKRCIFGTFGTGFVSVYKVFVQTTDGSKAGPVVTFTDVIFGCYETFSLTTKGMLGLSRDRASLPSQLSPLLNAKKFAICLPSKTNIDGILFLGKSPYKFFPGYSTSKLIDVTSRFRYTKIHTNYQRTETPRIHGLPLPEYYVKITSIMVNGVPIKINSTLLEFQKTGVGGSKITTIKPYTTFETSIYKALVKVFDAKLLQTPNLKKVEAIAPFSDCYSVGNLGMSILGPGVPEIAFTFEDETIRWDILGANSMVEINRNNLP